ncbi:MAG: Shedu immune nuclease family protein [Sulfuricurvum sp.]
MNIEYDSLCNEFFHLVEEDSKESLEKISEFLLKKEFDTFDKHNFPYFACHALLQKGPRGIDKLIEILERIDGSIYPNAIVRSLWMASKGKLYKPLFSSICSQLSTPLTQETMDYAREAFLTFVIKGHVDPETFHRLIQFMYFQTIEMGRDKDEYIEFHQDIFNILTDSTIKISQDVITGFASLIDEQTNEEKYQLYFEQHPVLVDPLAMSIIDKQKLGTEYITDFVVETLKGDYILVEIEKPQDKIFTQAGDFSSSFSHAFGQVLDFIEWVESNIAYAQTKLPGITAPRGLLVIGRSTDLTNQMRKKLRRFNRNSNSIEVLTYDDVLSRAESLYNNIKKKISLEA